LDGDEEIFYFHNEHNIHERVITRGMTMDDKPLEEKQVKYLLKAFQGFFLRK
jgi:hypothetical protein